MTRCSLPLHRTCSDKSPEEFFIAKSKFFGLSQCLLWPATPSFWKLLSSRGCHGTSCSSSSSCPLFCPPWTPLSWYSLQFCPRLSALCTLLSLADSFAHTCGFTATLRNILCGPGPSLEPEPHDYNFCLHPTVTSTLACPDLRSSAASKTLCSCFPHSGNHPTVTWLYRPGVPLLHHAHDQPVAMEFSLYQFSLACGSSLLTVLPACVSLL